MANKTCLEQGN